MERADRYGERKEESITFQHMIEVEVEINRVNNVRTGDIQKTPSHSVKPCSKCKSTSNRGIRREAHTAAVAAAGIPCSSTHTSIPSSPSQISIISNTAAEELCDLRNYYSKQLRRINYISHEYLGQPTEPGVLACIREPLRRLHLPCISESARSLWTRISGRRKLVHC